ncbi:tyrosine--tRNA ligase [Rhabdochlamydiaceae symbiont of Dictyostelium giganteum]|uniref:tyrosine--tRNA ligase n=1 Tax=Rhabdochlamydiaceae symbiont of Dictyostelium giganteum TaxID=3342349 RepID=UPI00384CF00E
MNVIDCLIERGLVDAVTSPEIKAACDKPVKIYIGFDPTASSLHLGNLVGIMILKWFQKFGHTPVILLGGATGRIGDPSGKSLERVLLDAETVEKNIEGIRSHFEQILDFTGKLSMPIMVNNEEWFANYSFVNFLRDIGKHFRVNIMMNKEMVKNRLQSEEGISFTEFSYQLLQSYDFYHLFEKGVSIQGGGSDQWGNITAGVELIRKLTGKSALGLTFPLLTRSDGKKFGKTEQGAIWLAKDRTSPYEFYQHIYKIPDADVIKLMKMVTMMDMEEIRFFEKALQDPSYIPNTAQKRLAQELTLLVHGESGLASAMNATEAVLPGHKGDLTEEAFHQMMKDFPCLTLNKSEWIGKKLTELMVYSKLVSSKGEAARLISQSGAYLNNNRVEDAQGLITEESLLYQAFILLAAGKKNKVLIRLT